jgi:pimeloyl-ACP methyl ester carboxylesterase
MQPASQPGTDVAQQVWTERYVSANGIRFHLLESGPPDAPLVLLLHGYPEFSYSWRYQLAGLADRYHVVAPDLRGYNLSEKPPSGYDIVTLTEDVRGLIAALGESHAHIVGHDWGGIVSWAVAIRAPDVVNRLAIVNAPHPGTFQREFRNPRQIARSSYIGFFQLRGIAERAIAKDNFAMLRRTLRAADRERAWLSDEDIARYVEAMAQPGALSPPLEYYRQLRRLVPLLSPLRTITAPTLVLWGELDPYLGTQFLDGLDRWGADLQIQLFPTAGHWLNQQEPVAVNAALRAFLG